jgi:cysteine desulfurase
MFGNNETGVIADLANICGICRRFDVPVHSDAVQAIGKIDVNMTELGLSALSLTAHKIHGPVGIGALILPNGISLSPLLIGGGQQQGLRPGTEPVIPTIALTMAVRLGCQARMHRVYETVAQLRDRFEASLIPLESVEILASHSPRLPHVSNIAFLGLDRQALHMALDLAGIACSTGAACSSGSSRPSQVLTAMGLHSETVLGSIRFSFSRFTTAQEVEIASQIVAQVVLKLRSK